MPISGRTTLYLIVGHPVAQVRAPELFNAVFERFGIDAVLAPANVSPADLEAFVRTSAHAGNIGGFWVAIPHKAPLAHLVDDLDPMATAAGAVNAVRRTFDGRLSGALFDGIGFVKALDAWGVASAGSRTLIAGAGGGGVAIAAALGSRGADAVSLFDAMPGKAAAAATRLGSHFPATTFTATDSKLASGFDIVVNASPLGMEASDPLPFDPATLDAGATVVDIGMKNQPTALLRRCHELGIPAHPGFEMLVQQTPEYLRFFGYEDAAVAVERDLDWVRTLITPPEFR